MKVEEVKKILGLEPLIREGGFYKKTFRSGELIPGGILEGHDTKRAISGGIYFMHDQESCSRLHRLKSDEIYHFYLGDPVLLTVLWPDGIAQTVRLGHDIMNGEMLQYHVPKGCWQGSRLADGGSFALMGTMMTPDFEEEDYQDVDDLRGGIEELTGKYPSLEHEIRRLEKARC